jgi:hypothetical protein
VKETKDTAAGIGKKAPWPLFENFDLSESGYGKYLATWIKRRNAVAEFDEIPTEPLIDHWLAHRLAVEQGWSDMEAMEDYEDDPDDLWPEAQERLGTEGDCVFSLFWDSGGPGAGAEEERIYRWKDKFFFFSEYWEVPNPFESLDAALEASNLLNVNTATQWIRCKDLSAEELTLRLSVGDDVNGLDINGEQWRFDSKLKGWTREQI